MSPRTKPEHSDHVRGVLATSLSTAAHRCFSNSAGRGIGCPIYSKLTIVARENMAGYASASTPQPWVTPPPTRPPSPHPPSSRPPSSPPPAPPSPPPPSKTLPPRASPPPSRAPPPPTE